jgi:hypothetical protein
LHDAPIILKAILPSSKKTKKNKKEGKKERR